jgi:chromosome segregation ATPase
MTKLNDALARFAAALDRLEVCAEERMARARESATTAAELSVVRAEREELAARVASLEEESRTLAGLTEEVEGRLDGAITEIRAVLGRH